MRTTALHQSTRRAAAIGCCVVAILATLSGAAFSQNLTNLPGLTELQQPTATAVQTVCGSLRDSPSHGGPTYNPNNPITPTDHLFASCRVMVQTANKLAGVTDPTMIANSLDIGNEQLRTGVQAVSPVQMNAQKQISVEASKMNQVGSRLLDLRGGARGFVVGLNGQETRATGAADSQARNLAGAIGGALLASFVMLPRR